LGFRRRPRLGRHDPEGFENSSTPVAGVFPSLAILLTVLALNLLATRCAMRSIPSCARNDTMTNADDDAVLTISNLRTEFRIGGACTRPCAICR